MISTLLIANRGEIACRIIATARRLGIATVAVYSDADATALHVRMADRAARIGPAPVTESYLNTQAILAAAQATGAEAIHPGYGFLSENPDFVEAVEQAGLAFVGPPATAIRAMGLKDAAKALMEKAGVPVVPGYHGADQNPGLLAGEARKIGYPVLIKARAGGGGKGMRLVEDPKDFAEALEGAQREGKASFGDAAVLIEKFVTTPRHIEVQVFADRHCNILHLFERDCSLQRRHQKVIEEAPAPGMTPEMRAAMGQAAVEAARAIGYVGAGTVEFIADGSGPLRPDGFWFMEMNTRLQVEHPVTEAITGLDLVEWQLRTAAGEPLPLTQEALTIDGHAFEARLYAEDPATGFLPSTGRLDTLAFPDGTAFEPGPTRIDAGVAEGDDVTPHYDPMIAKLITHGPDRAAALRRLTRALEATRITGVSTNAGFLARLARHPGFAAGRVDTGLIGREADALTGLVEPSPHARAAACLTALNLPRAPSPDPWHSLTGWRPWGEATHNVHLNYGGEVVEIAVTILDRERFRIDGTVWTARASGDALTLTASDAIQTSYRRRTDGRIWIFEAGETLVFNRPDPLGPANEIAAEDALTAPMPGLVIRVSTTAGATVARGQSLLVLEAMKMEHTLRAPRDGTIAEVLAEEGAQVAGGALLIRMEREDD